MHIFNGILLVASAPVALANPLPYNERSSFESGFDLSNAETGTTASRDDFSHRELNARPSKAQAEISLVRLGMKENHSRPVQY